MIALSTKASTTRWAVFRILPNGIKTVYTVDTEARAKTLAQETKDMFSNSRVFVGYEIAQSTEDEAEDEID
jgi:hypothetical protein